jgi:roadblock/LC7 domain-containing protein
VAGRGNQGKGLFVEFPPALEVMGSFCSAVQSMFNALAVAMGGFSPSTWTPVHGWAASGGIYSIAVHGDRFVVVETDKVRSFDELSHLLQARKP